ncbi:hypothetical protein C8Q80DRAFT_1276322 [Daedaleopsis nitida]|nr:hypothetical protein C8Q80DRAFT_1276322 [Daedaleopsis nitida]
MPYIMLRGLRDLAEKERRLREGQMNDSLQSIRTAIGYKSMLYRHRVRKANLTRAKLRSFDEVHVAEETIRRHVCIYTQSRQATLTLFEEGNTVDARERISFLARYKPIAKDDLKASTTVLEALTPRLHMQHEAWFWSIEDPAAGTTGEWIKNFRRMLWLRALARKRRWEEERKFVLFEMDCIGRFFESQASDWSQLEAASRTPGHAAYAARKKHMWRSLKEHAYASCLPTAAPPLTFFAPTVPPAARRPKLPLDEEPNRFSPAMLLPSPIACLIRLPLTNSAYRPMDSTQPLAEWVPVDHSVAERSSSLVRLVFADRTVRPLSPNRRASQRSATTDSPSHRLCLAERPAVTIRSPAELNTSTVAEAYAPRRSAARRRVQDRPPHCWLTDRFQSLQPARRVLCHPPSDQDLHALANHRHLPTPSHPAVAEWAHSAKPSGSQSAPVDQPRGIVERYHSFLHITPLEHVPRSRHIDLRKLNNAPGALVHNNKPRPALPPSMIRVTLP